jgi:anti-sigma regulatory factor (Ser/Thr protein kinase)
MSTTSPSTGEYRISIVEALDVFVVRWTAQRLAAVIGFSSQVRQELAIVVSELATNILKYGVRGQIAMAAVDDPGLGRGIELIAEDEGPPLADLGIAVRDGHCDRGPIDPAKQIGRGGIGAGLGAVIRLTDSFDYRPGPHRKSFRVVRYLARPRPGKHR